MVKCWAQRPTDRPHFPDIIKHHLDPLEARLKGCVCRGGEGGGGGGEERGGSESVCASVERL